MFLFVLRRLLISIPILIASSFLVFGLVTVSGDPLSEILGSSRPNRLEQAAALRVRLDLDKPFPERYVKWASGVVRGDFGQNKRGQDVAPILKQALVTTLRLVVLATVLSITMGLAVGILSAVRQYSVFDYSTTFSAFLFFALPVFWLAVLLKQFGAIEFNNFLENPGLSGLVIALLAVFTGLFWSAVLGGTKLRRLTIGAGTGLAALVLLVLLDNRQWFDNPGLSPPVLFLAALGASALGTLLFSRLGNRRVLLPAVVTAVVGLIGSWIFSSWIESPNWSRLLMLAAMSVCLGLLCGAALGGIDRRGAMSAGAVTATFVGFVVLADQLISAWKPGRTIATVGPQSPNLKGTFWERMIDYTGHQILPSLALALIGFATFSRFTRASMLETMKSDYVRTARAKGLPQGRVILRHAFRTALIPVTTVIAVSFGGVIAGATITENVFSWKGMGTMFLDGLRETDPYPIMATMLVVSLSVVLFNAIADVLYAYLDPRIRLD